MRGVDAFVVVDDPYGMIALSSGVQIVGRRSCGKSTALEPLVFNAGPERVREMQRVVAREVGLHRSNEKPSRKKARRPKQHLRGLRS